MALFASGGAQDGRCFVQTAQLDGETNLKRRVACFNEENCGTVDFHVRFQLRLPATAFYYLCRSPFRR